MKSGSVAHKGGAIRSLLTWILVLLVVANVAVWSAWPFKQQLMAWGILAPPPIERVDFDPQPLPPIVESVVAQDQPVESSPSGQPESEDIAGIGPTVPPEDTSPSSSRQSPGIEGEAGTAGRTTSLALLDCVIVGPIESREALDAVAARLRSMGALVDGLEAAGVAPLDYAVYVEPAVSRAAAEIVKQELHAQSIEDAEVMWRGPYENAVAVGVYRNRGFAHMRRDQIAALGHAVKVRERHRLRAREVSADALGDLDNKPCPDEAR